MIICFTHDLHILITGNKCHIFKCWVNLKHELRNMFAIMNLTKFDCFRDLTYEEMHGMQAVVAL